MHIVDVTLFFAPHSGGVKRYLLAKRQYFAANAVGGYPFVGTPDRVAEELAVISRAGVRGIAVSFVNYLRELPYFCDEVLPRLERMELREKHRSRRRHAMPCPPQGPHAGERGP